MSKNSSVGEQIKDLVKEKYNGYSGRALVPVKKAHDILRKVKGDDWFLEFLISRPSLPKYEMSEEAKLFIKNGGSKLS